MAEYPFEQPGANSSVIAFLHYHLTPDELTWPRSVPPYRDVKDVPMGGLTVHPDLLEWVTRIVPDLRGDRRMLMGTLVLVAPNGIIYALTTSQTFLGVRLPSEIASTFFTPANPAPQRHERVALLGDAWTAAPPFGEERVAEALHAARAACTLSA